MSNAEQRNGKAQSKASSEERDRMLPNGTPTGKTAEDPHYSEPEIDGTRGLPIDRGWAWVVLGGRLARDYTIILDEFRFVYQTRESFAVLNV